MGKTAVYEGEPSPCSFASYLIRVKLLEGVRPALVAQYINSPFGRRWIKTVVNQQVGQANVNGSKLKELAIPLPPLAEQSAILDRVEAALAQRQTVAQVALRACERLAELDQSILAKAFRGELVRQDANDEPASVLLERTRAERERADAGGNTRARRGRRARASEPESADAEGDPVEVPTAAHASGANGNGTTLHTVLGALKREALYRIADAEGVELADRRSLEAARAGVVEGGVTLEATLTHLDRDELKAACRALGLQDRGRTKEELRARIAGAPRSCPVTGRPAADERERGA